MTQTKKYQKDLPTLRQSLTSIDEQIVKHLIQRLKISEQIAAVKMSLDIATEDREREQEVVAAAVNAAAELTDSAIHIQAIRELLPQIIEWSKSVQEQYRRSLEKTSE